jgi:chromosome segregation protein
LFLKSLEIYGFKSFGEKTKFQFKPGVTAIVGPNGCGKSNVVDAIRWVLGEANARSLRGEVMDDVIFSGSEERKPLGMAEVGITVVNDDELLPIEYSEVNIKRRLYRSGESEFFINRNSVRLKDIHELFADTGIGKAAYSIMEQGNIDMILSNKPEERMVVFEEAAGITRYKTRMKQSYRKLASTEENLIRLNLIINEVEKEKLSLEKQAQKALQYKTLKKEELKFEKLYNYTRVRNLDNQLKKNNMSLEELKTQKKSQEKTLEDLNASLRRKIGKIKEVERDISGLENAIFKIETEIESISSKSAHIDERVFELKNEIAKKNQLKIKIHAAKTELEQSIDRQCKEKEALTDLVRSQEEKLAGYVKELQYVDQSVEKISLKIGENNGKCEEIGGELHTLRESLKEVTNRLLQEIDTIKTRFGGKEQKKNLLVENIKEAVQNIDNALRRYGARIHDFLFLSEDAERKSKADELKKEIDDLRNRMQDMFSNIETVISIQDELSRMIFGKEGVHSQKEQIEKDIERNTKLEARLKKENGRLSEELGKNRRKKEEFENTISNLRPEIARNREKEKYHEENIVRLKDELEKSDESLEDVDFDIQTLEDRIKKLITEKEVLTERRGRKESRKVQLRARTKEQNALIEKFLEDIGKTESSVEDSKSKVEQLSFSVEKIDLNNAELSTKIETIKENFRERYSVSLDILGEEDLAGETVIRVFSENGEPDLRLIQEQREKIKKNVSELGQVNLIAIEEYNETKKRLDYLTDQKQDLERAKNDLHIVMDKTLRSSKDLFMESFEKINSNFNGIFRRLFNGGNTDLFLTDASNVFETGVEIMACPPGKSLKRRSLLSGGEKGLTAIALLFAIFMVRPSPFCMLDEVDHDLDEENVIRFLRLLKEFTDTTQFIIITHNRRTIEFSDVIYGITAEEAGVSKVVSLDMVEHAIE